MNNELIDKLSKLKLEKTSLKRNLDRNYYNVEVRTRLFRRIKVVDNEISKVKFKLRLEKEKENDNSNSSKSQK